MANVVLGKNVNVEALIEGSYVTIGCAISCSFEYENEIIGKTDVNAGLSRKKRVRMGDNRGSVQGLTTIESSSTKLTVFYFLQEAVRRAEQTMRFIFIDEVNETRVISGIFLVRAVSITSDVSAFSEFDLQLEGTGGISIGTVDPVPGTICPELTSDTWETTEGTNSITGPGQQGRNFEGDDILEVDREGTQLDYTSGTPGNREYGYDGVTISVDSTNPFNPGEKMFVVWKAFES